MIVVGSVLLAAACSSSGGASTPTDAPAPTSAAAPATAVAEPATTIGVPTTTAVPVTTTSAPATTAATTTTTEEEVVEPFQILVTNDDGVSSPGIDAVVEGLRTLEFLVVTVVAPLENQSGKGDSFTDPAAGPLVVTDTTTQSGYPAKAVAGTPADSIIWAVEQNGVERPDFVISGVNNGQNMSIDVMAVSGTIGAARRAAANGIPSIAVSFTSGDDSDYTPAVDALLAWFTENAPQRIGDAAAGGVESFTNMNVPNCPSIGAEIAGVVEVSPGALGDRDYGALTCDGAPNPADDVAAYQSGWVGISELPALKPA